MTEWLRINLQQWTPFSTMVALVIASCMFLLIWDSITNTPVPVFVWAIIGTLLGGTGTVQAIGSGVKIANGTATNTVKALAEHLNVSSKIDGDTPTT